MSRRICYYNDLDSRTELKTKAAMVTIIGKTASIAVMEMVVTH